MQNRMDQRRVEDNSDVLSRLSFKRDKWPQGTATVSAPYLFPLNVLYTGFSKRVKFFSNKKGRGGRVLIRNKFGR